MVAAILLLHLLTCWLLAQTHATASDCSSAPLPDSFEGQLARDYSFHAARLPLAGTPTVPISDRSKGPYCNVTAAGTDVSVQVRFYKVESVEQTQGHMKSKCGSGSSGKTTDWHGILHCTATSQNIT